MDTYDKEVAESKRKKALNEPNEVSIRFVGYERGKKVYSALKTGRNGFYKLISLDL